MPPYVRLSIQPGTAKTKMPTHIFFQGATGRVSNAPQCGHGAATGTTPTLVNRLRVNQAIALWHPGQAHFDVLLMVSSEIPHRLQNVANHLQGAPLCQTIMARECLPQSPLDA